MHIDETRGLIREARSFRVYRAANQVVAVGTTKVVFDTVSYDPYALVNLTTGQITLPAGVWMIGGSVGCTGATAPVGINIYKNAAQASAGNYNVGDNGGAGALTAFNSVADVVVSNGTDVFDLRTVQPAAATVFGGSALTYFYGVRVG